MGRRVFSFFTGLEGLNLRALPTIDMAATGKNIARLREGVGLSVRALQAVLGFTSPQAIYKWQRGESLPSIDNLAALAAVLDVGLDDIVIYQNEKEKAL